MGERRESIHVEEPLADRIDELDESFVESLKLGQDLRFLLVCLGGGAARIGREITSRHLRYLETVVINCDPRVQELDEFDRRVCLGAGESSAPATGGSPAVGSHLARAAEPALERIFEGATFVTIVTTLGGGTGTGVLPYVLEAAARKAAVLSVFAVKPFRCEGERRALADRALARLHFVDAWVEKLQHRLATLTVLDNESLVPEAAQLPMNRMNRHWADLVATHIEKAFVIPAEAAVEAGRLAALTESEALLPRPTSGAPTIPSPSPMPAPPPGPSNPMLPALYSPADFGPGAQAGPLGVDAELTFEVVSGGPRGPEQP